MVQVGALEMFLVISSKEGDGLANPDIDPSGNEIFFARFLS